MPRPLYAFVHFVYNNYSTIKVNLPRKPERRFKVRVLVLKAISIYIITQVILAF